MAILANDIRFRVEQPDIFSEVTKVGGVTGAVTHSYWSEFFNRHPFDVVRDIEYDEPGGPISHGRFHTMTNYDAYNQMTPSDTDLFATLTMLTKRFGIDYGILHTVTRSTRWGIASVTTASRWTMPASSWTARLPPSFPAG